MSRSKWSWRSKTGSSAPGLLSDTLGHLPLEVFELVASILARADPRTLVNLALTNKSYWAWCQPAIKSVFFHDIKIRVEHGDLADQTEKLATRLRQADALPYVRRLLITGQLCYFHPVYSPNYPNNFTYEWEKPVMKDLRQSDGSDSRWTQFGCLNEEVPPLGDCGAIYKDDRHWRPVASLIKDLPALRDLVYRPDEQFPPCLLDALHNYQPNCLLHLQTFNIGSVKEDSTDSYEYKLITSPSLYSIMTTNWPRRNTPEPISFDHKKALRRVLGLAPGLKDIYWRYITHDNAPTDSWSSPSWDKFSDQKDEARLPRAALTRLRIKCSGLLRDTALFGWAEHTDFSVLERLELSSVAGAEVLDNWSMNLSFPSLQAFFLNLGETKTPEFYQAALNFLRCLPPLLELHLEGWHPLVSMDSLVDQHGSRLRKLVLSGTRKTQNCLNESSILQIGSHCPFLEDLQITLKRSQGDATEVALYRALGTIRRLKYLTLALNASDPALIETENMDYHGGTPTDPSFDEFDNQISKRNIGTFYRSRNGHVRRVLVNSAVDEDLVNGIFNTISSSKCSDVLLEELAIEVVNEHNNMSFANLLAHRWLVKRDWRYSHRSELLINEVGVSDGTWSWRRDHLYHHAWQAEIVCRIWPNKNKARRQKGSMRFAAKDWRKTRISMKGPWWDYWHSFPLATEEP